MGKYKRWAGLMVANPAIPLIATTPMSADERTIISTVALNEGKFDAINAWDDTIFSLGAMQKTLRNGDDMGELNKQLWDFKNENPDLFRDLIGNCGWDVTRTSSGLPVTYTDPATGAVYKRKDPQHDLYNKIREGLTSASIDKRQKCDMLLPFIMLGQHPVFQDKQVLDYLDRLRGNLCLDATPYIYADSSTTKQRYPAKVGQYFTSPFGRTVALDQSVNRPQAVGFYVGKALEKFFAAHPALSHNPDNWGDPTQRAAYEHQLVEIYGPLRGERFPLFPGSRNKWPAVYDNANRYKTIKDKLG
jgi:hypothetical protein